MNVTASPGSPLEINSSRLRQSMDVSSVVPPAPASPLAVPTETARNQVNQAALLPSMMAPSRDGIFTIGAVSVKRGSAIKVAGSRGFNSWGF